VSLQLKKLVPLADRVLVKRMVPVTKTAGGIILPEAATTKANQGEVLAVGPGARNINGDIIPISVKVGDKVLLPEYGGMQLKVDGSEDTYLFRNDEILARFNE
jgi:chaperonin GroES